MKIMVLFGTRPEIIKLAPVIRQLQRHAERATSVVVSTGQHREFTRQMQSFFCIDADYDLDVMRPRQSLAHVLVSVVQALDPILLREAPDVLVVQGDTMSSTAGAIAASLRGVRVAHVEAGLRTAHLHLPFPEEINRRLSGVLAHWHFAPTEWARDNLLREGKDPASIHVTGNTVIDALAAILSHGADESLELPVLSDKEILVTLHRRETLDGGLGPICRAIRDLVDDRPEASVVFPVHWNPRVREPVFAVLQGHPRVQLIDPLPYAPFLRLLQRSHFVMTDSGGLQEEAPALGKPVLVLRDVTERPEAVEAGVARLVGTDPRAIREAAIELLSCPITYRRMASGGSPFGDGHAGRRIVAALLGGVEGTQVMNEDVAAPIASVPAVSVDGCDSHSAAGATWRTAAGGSTASAALNRSES